MNGLNMLIIKELGLSLHNRTLCTKIIFSWIAEKKCLYRMRFSAGFQTG